MKSATRGDPLIRLALLAMLAMLVHGYHLGVDDAEIYVPAIKQAADPSLFPFGAEFFLAHAHLSLFSQLVGYGARLTRLPADLVIFLWHLGCIFLLFLAAWRLVCACFENSSARWGGIALLAGALSVPVAGTALVIMDPYLTARSLSTPATIFGIASYLSGRPRRCVAWLLLTELVHPQMCVYGLVFIGVLACTRRWQEREQPETAFGLLFGMILPQSFDFHQASGIYHSVLLTRTYFFLSKWAWYEWLGIFAPLALLWWFSTIKGASPAFRLLARALVPFGLLFTVAGLIVTFPEQMQNFARLQPMRAFHLLYVVMFLLVGGLLGEYVLRRHIWLWLGLFVPLAASMWRLQQSQYSSSAHVEWPGAGYRDPWACAFLWIRGHTPKDAVFALDPDYMLMPGEDEHGFRALAERSVLADNVKDSGAVSLFPQLAQDWKSQVDAQTGWAGFGAGEFKKLAGIFPVTWIVTRRPGPSGLTCPYENEELMVCRLPVPAHTTAQTLAARSPSSQ